MFSSRRLGALLDCLSRCDWRLPLVGAWAVFLLSPLWKTGWFNDDCYNSSLPGLCIHNNWSPVEDGLHEIHDWTFKVARINPLIHILKDASFWFFRDLFWYKTTIISLILINLLAFYRLLKRLSASPDLAALACFLAVTFIQFRAFYDPVLAYNGLLQLIFLGTVLSLSAFQRYLTGGRLRWLAFSFLFYVMTALTYEISYLFWLLHAGIFLTTRGRWIRAAALAPFVAVPFALTLGSMWLRTRPEYEPQGYAVGLEVRAVSETILKQITAAWPLSYAGWSEWPPAVGVFSWNTLGTHLPTLAFGFATAALLTAGLVRRRTGEQTRWSGLFLFGMLLAVLPAPLIGVARRYQSELQYGLGHLPVYIEYFGAALLCTTGVGFLAARLRPGGVSAKVLVGMASLLCAVVAVFHCEANNRVVAVLKNPYWSPRREVEEVLDRGRLLEGVPAGATLLVDGFPWDFGGGGNAFYCYHTQTRLKGVICSQVYDAPLVALLVTKPGTEEAPNVLRVRYNVADTERGWAVAGTIHRLQTAANGDVSQSGISNLRLAVRRGWHMGPDRPFILHTTYIASDGAATPQPVAIGPDEMTRIAVTQNWTVYDVKIPFPYVEGESLWLEFNPPKEIAHRAAAQSQNESSDQ